MLIVRSKTFSDKKKGNKEKVKGAAMIAGGVGGVIGSSKLGDKITEKGADGLLYSKLTAKDKGAVKEALLKKAKKQGIKVIESEGMDNSVYTGSQIGKGVRKAVAWGAKKLRKHGKGNEAKQLIDGISEGVESQIGDRKVFQSLGKDRVILGHGNLADTDVLAHELGHAQYLKKGRSKSLIGKAAHKVMPVSSLSATKVGQAGVLVHGVRAGIKNERKKQEGKKVGKWDKVRSVAVPTALAAPLLIAEGKASLNGLKAMKKAGASKELLSQSRKRLGSAWSTYAGQASKSIAAGGGGELIGRGYAKMTKKKEDNKK